MNNTNDKEDDNQMEIKHGEKMKTTSKIYVKQPHEILKDSLLKNTNDDVQRAIEGLKEIPDEELQEFLDDEDFMEGLDVVDAWEGDEERNRENEQDKTNAVERKERRSSRERHRPEPKGSYSRVKPKREEKKREEIRRDPLKSTKDIERDKIRTKRDTENKLLAEKEKAIKHLLDSDNVVPPGTEAEAIQSLTEEQNRERAQREAQRSREHRRSKSFDHYSRPSPVRRRSPDRLRSSPHRRRSPFVASPERRRSPYRTSAERHRSPHRYSPGRRKNSPRYFSDRRSPVVLSPDRRRSPRRLSGERRSSVDRKWSVERSRRRRTEWIHERRRSRSHDRRSRSTERQRRRSSRSPASRRYSPRRRSRTRTRSRSVEKRTRKRSPFINELARQLRNEAMKPTSMNSSGYVPPATMEGIAPLLNPPVYQQEAEPRPPPPPPPPSASSTYMHQPGPHAPPLPPSSMLPIPSGPPFINYESMPGVPPMNFEPMPPPAPSHILPPADYSSAPVMYNQPNVVPPPPPSAICPTLLPTPVLSPQPVPAPVMDHTQIPYNPSHTMASVRRSPIRQFESTSKSSNHSTAPSTASQNYTERGSATSYTEFHAPHEERMKTPEPPVISKPKQKTSLSSLLEASVSAKDPSNIPVLYPGFKPEIMRHCEQALCQLPLEDLRLKMKGRFFYDRNEEDHTKNDAEDHTSNSILLQKGKTKIFWEESNVEQQISIPKSTTQMHQKICQTDEMETETKAVQVHVTMVNVETQVYSHDLPQIKEEKRPIMDRLDWNVRETYEYAPKFREVEDLRWSLSNSSQRRSWNRQPSPSRRSADEHEHHVDSIDHGSRDHGSRSLRLESPVRSRDDFSAHNARDHYNHSRYSPEYHRRSMERDDFHDRRSDHSRGESPMELEESDDELVDDHAFQREHDWHGRGKNLRGKSHILRGKHLGGRPYRSRGSFRGKF
ncbi:serine/arginine repetitive matrix protein 1-like [Cataglyphis hispanica]|uniref:serine/arginine repetitive matrix protein 1-like n=1 Tax=Cataglyphis hispanica TaxID=1086592 RepID=UPI00217FFF3E|nr:serine/arginine repetitive matrix protein 1-like [Cataglyphis hispanica]XP_050463383.1 serine/arginine repetitive matrix protein 1-like [Cataglyphis hispanica]XP_050463384.1 serine/arginine repetitive matrix protein 1-like [Cataglyphis hispanica]